MCQSKHVRLIYNIWSTRIIWTRNFQHLYIIPTAKCVHGSAFQKGTSRCELQSMVSKPVDHGPNSKQAPGSSVYGDFTNCKTGSYGHFLYIWKYIFEIWFFGKQSTNFLVWTSLKNRTQNGICSQITWNI